MTDMTGVRVLQVDQLRRAINVLGYVLKTTPTEDATTLRDGGDGWTIAEVMGHLRDFDLIFLERGKMTLSKVFPQLPLPDPDKLAVENAYNDQNVMDMYQEWVEAREDLVAFFESVREDDWERAARHPTRGHFTLNEQLILAVWHDTNHLNQIIHILSQRER